MFRKNSSYTNGAPAITVLRMIIGVVFFATARKKL